MRGVKRIGFRVGVHQRGRRGRRGRRGGRKRRAGGLVKREHVLERELCEAHERQLHAILQKERAEALVEACGALLHEDRAHGVRDARVVRRDGDHVAARVAVVDNRASALHQQSVQHCLGRVADHVCREARRERSEQLGKHALVFGVWSPHSLPPRRSRAHPSEHAD